MTTTQRKLLQTAGAAATGTLLLKRKATAAVRVLRPNAAAPESDFGVTRGSHAEPSWSVQRVHPFGLERIDPEPLRMFATRRTAVDGTR